MLMPFQEPAAPQVRPVPTGEALLTIEGIAKRFGDAVVLDGIDLAIADGEFVALLGPSGCGKTTLLRILCGIESPSAGRVRLHGQDITHWSPAQRGFGVVFQSYALFPNLTAAQNVAYGLSGMSRVHRAQRVREMLDLVGLSGHADHFPAQLSGGQQQRVALARALAPSPRLVLLDEPLSALDAQVRTRLRDEIRAICTRLGVATVMVTHDQDEALSMADRVVLMHRGRIEQAGSPQALYAQPRSAFVAGFVGRMNLWQGTVLGPRRVLVGQAVLEGHASAANDAAEERVLIPGQRLSVGIRPEQVMVSAHDPSWDRQAERDELPTNTLIAEIASIGFHGAHGSLKLRCADLESDIEVELPTPPGAQLPFALRERVRVHLPPGALALLPSR